MTPTLVFFHKTVAARQSRSTITALIDSEGKRISTLSEIAKEAVSFFQKLIGTEDVQVSSCPREILSELLTSSLSEEAQVELIKPVSAAEIKSTLFAIGGEKAPGLDGYTSFFFRFAWPIVGGDVTNAILYFFQNTSLIPAFNSTIVALVPKCKNPSSMKEFRPIFCCSVIYKCITKILANRMQKFLPNIIGRNQSAFTVGRSSSDNIFMAQELVKGYGRANLSSRCALKIDLQKAFDTLNWNFVMDVLASFKFPPIFIYWIKCCLTSPMYSISLNGGLVGYFMGERGVRQGDPLSPYIFVLAMDVLSKLLDAAADHGVFNYHPKCKKIKLTHLSFADNLMIFTKGYTNSIEGVQKVLQLFYTYSGLQLNSEKSEFFSSGINKPMVD